jgi:uroporphyrinogen decarboxylase
LSRATRFIDACNLKPTDCTPIWFMRQAGRYQAEYRKLREKHSIIDLCKTPDLATQVTMLPVDQMDVDAAIIFGDLMLPLEGMGVTYKFVEGMGPVIDKPLRSDEQIRALRKLNPAEHVPYLLEAIRLVRAELNGKVPLIGFGGLPFTLAAYMIEGKGSRDYRYTKTLMFSRPRLWADLMAHLSEMAISYLSAQVEAGAQAIQLFDSWIGALAATDYREHVLPHVKSLFEGLSNLGVPLIHFGTGTGPFLEAFAEAGGHVVSVDWKIPLAESWDRIGRDRAIQGNLDPTLLFAPMEVAERKSREILDSVAGRPGHIFNLGHGILPGTPVDTVRRLVDFVHEESARKAGTAAEI